MKEPIIVNDNGSIDVFETVEKAERYIESIDVKNNEFDYFDSEGRILQAFVVKDSKGVERTVIKDKTEAQFNDSELRIMLMTFLKHLGYSKSEFEKMHLSQLVQESLKYKTE